MQQATAMLGAQCAVAPHFLAFGDRRASGSSGKLAAALADAAVAADGAGAPPDLLSPWQSPTLASSVDQPPASVGKTAARDVPSVPPSLHSIWGAASPVTGMSAAGNDVFSLYDVPSLELQENSPSPGSDAENEARRVSLQQHVARSGGVREASALYAPPLLKSQSGDGLLLSPRMNSAPLPVRSFSDESAVADPHRPLASDEDDLDSTLFELAAMKLLDDDGAGATLGRADAAPASSDSQLLRDASLSYAPLFGGSMAQQRRQSGAQPLQQHRFSQDQHDRQYQEVLAQQRRLLPLVQQQQQQQQFQQQHGHQQQSYHQHAAQQQHQLAPHRAHQHHATPLSAHVYHLGASRLYRDVHTSNSAAQQAAAGDTASDAPVKTKRRRPGKRQRERRKAARAAAAAAAAAAAGNEHSSHSVPSETSSSSSAIPNGASVLFSTPSGRHSQS